MTSKLYWINSLMKRNLHAHHQLIGGLLWQGFNGLFNARRFTWGNEYSWVRITPKLSKLLCDHAVQQEVASLVLMVVVGVSKLFWSKVQMTVASFMRFPWFYEEIYVGCHPGILPNKYCKSEGLSLVQGLGGRHWGHWCSNLTSRKRLLQRRRLAGEMGSISLTECISI